MYAAVFPYLGAAAAEEELHIPPPPDPAAPKGLDPIRSGPAVGHRAGLLGPDEGSEGDVDGERDVFG